MKSARLLTLLMLAILIASISFAQVTVPTIPGGPTVTVGGGQATFAGRLINAAYAEIYGFIMAAVGLAILISILVILFSEHTSGASKLAKNVIFGGAAIGLPTMLLWIKQAAG